MVSTSHTTGFDVGSTYSFNGFVSVKWCTRECETKESHGFLDIMYFA